MVVLMFSAFQAQLDRGLQDVAEIDFSQAQVAVAVVLDVLQPREILLGHVEHHASAITATPSRRPSLSRLMIAPVSVSTMVFSGSAR